MANFIQRLRRLWDRQSKTRDAIAVKELFKVHYWHFKSLLRLNERALVILSLMEQASRQGRPFGMPFIRGNTTSLSIHVYKIIQELNQLADHRYAGLFDTFQRIQQTVQTVLSPPPAEYEGPFIRSINDLSKDDAEKAGRKMAVLGEIKGRVYPQVPDGFVVTIRAEQQFMAHNRLRQKIDQVFQSYEPDDLNQLLELSGEIQQLIMNAPLPPEVAEAIEDGCIELVRTHGGRQCFADPIPDRSRAKSRMDHP